MYEFNKCFETLLGWSITRFIPIHINRQSNDYAHK